MIGRSHAIHGEPIARVQDRRLAGGSRTQPQPPGAPRAGCGRRPDQWCHGHYANTDPQVEAISCEILGLTPDTASTQVISRDRHADYVQTLALVGASLDRFSADPQPAAHRCARGGGEPRQGPEGQLRHAPQTQPDPRTDQRPGQVLRSYVVAALENVALWHERDISHSSTERMMLPDCSVTLHFMLQEMTSVVKGSGFTPTTCAAT